MRRRGMLAVLVCSMLLCAGCQNADEKQSDQNQAASEKTNKKDGKEDNKKESEKGKNYSPIVAEGSVDMENEYPYEIRVNRAANCITVYGADDSGSYTIPVRAMICSTGGKETPEGIFQLGETSRWQMEADGEFSQYATGIVDGISFQSVPYYTQNNQNLDVEAFNELGQAVSGASIRLETADAKWIFKNCPDGTKVEIYDDETDEGPLGKPDARKLDKDEKKDPTDKGKLSKKAGNYVPVEFEGTDDCEVGTGEVFDIMEGVTASDKEQDLTAQIRAYGQVDTSKEGTCTVTYVCRNEEGETRVILRKIQVKDKVQEEPQETPEPTETPAPVQENQTVISNPFNTVTEEPAAAPAPTPAPTPEPVEEPVQIIYRDTQPPQIELIAQTRFTNDVSFSTLQNRVRISDDSGQIQAFYITVQPLSQIGYYVVIYEVIDAAGNARCLSETVQVR